MCRSFISIVLISILQILFCTLAQASITPFQASPDQVLVLYNEDWPRDVDGSEPGQDSREVAEYYVRMHTDPTTGEKPYMLGLRCIHGENHLNDWVIREKSQDNRNGVVFVGKGDAPKPWARNLTTKEIWPRDSRHVEIVLEPGKEQIDWNSVEIWCQSDQTGEKKPVSPTVTGIPRKKGRELVRPNIEEGKGRCYQFDAHQLFKGTVWVIFKAKDTSGKTIRDLKLKYYDLDDFEFSAVGPDGISDEKHFQEDVAIPVKRFLEDPKNVLPDGTLLKHHILYIVICHGLPFSCEGVFGIERGVTGRPADHGDLASLEQRLQTLYYDWGGTITPPVFSMFMSQGPDWKKGVRNYRITNAMRNPLFGQRWNPYMHPDTYSFLAKNKAVRSIDLPPFSEHRLLASPFFYAYGVSRIDGQGPREAKRQIDYSLYASKFLRPEMDSIVRDNLKKQDKNRVTDLTEKLRKAEEEGRWGADEEEALGFTVVTKYSGQGVPFLKRRARDASATRSQTDKMTKQDFVGYYPGAMDRTVVSSNGWNMCRSAGIWQQVGQGVTISACGGPAYGGGPHITNATFWDNRILLRYLFRGRDLGECFLLSTCYVNWSTSLLGDPLLHPDLSKTVLDDTPPDVTGKESIRIALKPAMGKYTGTMIIPVVSTAASPEVAELVVYYSEKGRDMEQISHWPIYSTQPYVVLRNLEAESTYTYRPLLTDPYGNTTDVSKIFGELSFRTPPLPNTEMKSHKAKKRSKGWEIDFRGLGKLAERGTIEVDFVAGENGLIPSILSKNLNIRVQKSHKGKIQVSMEVGEPKQTWLFKSPLQKAEEGKLILRWRRFPLTREVLLKAKTGSEFTLVADVRTPWEDKKLEGPIMIKEAHGLKILGANILDDSLPASPQACGITVPPSDEAVWEKANTE